MKVKGRLPVISCNGGGCEVMAGGTGGGCWEGRKSRKQGSKEKIGWKAERREK